MVAQNTGQRQEEKDDDDLDLDLDWESNVDDFTLTPIVDDDSTFSLKGDEELMVQPLALCQVCYEMQHFQVRPCCAGSVCDQCLRRYAEMQLTDIGNIRVICPFDDCNRFLYSDEMRRLLAADLDLLGKYERWIEAANCQDPHRKTCPRCCRVTEVEPSLLSGRKAAKYGVQVRCQDCELEWCFPCQSPAHRGMTCKVFLAGDKLLKRWATDVRAVGDRNARRCPKCKVRIYQI